MNRHHNPCSADLQPPDCRLPGRALTVSSQHCHADRSYSRRCEKTFLCDFSEFGPASRRGRPFFPASSGQSSDFTFRPGHSRRVSFGHKPPVRRGDYRFQIRPRDSKETLPEFPTGPPDDTAAFKQFNAPDRKQGSLPR